LRPEAALGNNGLLVTEIESRRSTQAISDESVAFLRSLPLSLVHGHCRFAHALPVGDSWKVKTVDEAADAMKYINRGFPSVGICFIGHNRQGRRSRERAAALDFLRGRWHIAERPKRPAPLPPHLG